MPPWWMAVSHPRITLSLSPMITAISLADRPRLRCIAARYFREVFPSVSFRAMSLSSSTVVPGRKASPVGAVLFRPIPPIRPSGYNRAGQP